MPTVGDLAPGTLFAGDYRVERALGGGGMGAVYIAEQLSTSQRRALKLMRPELVADPMLRRRFELEARVGARIASDHVVQVIQAGVDETTGMPWIAMELLDGASLAEHVERHGAVAPSEVAEIFDQLGHALSAAHAASIVHRDLKPENVFLANARRRGAPFMLKVLDFGIARLSADVRTSSATGTGLGTPLWMAPEQAEANADIRPATDVWALGLIAFFLLTGRVFWKAAYSDAPVMALAMEAFMHPVPAASERAAERGSAELLPAGFDGWFARCVARAPADRFVDAAAAVAPLLALLGHAADRPVRGAAFASAEPPRDSSALTLAATEPTPPALAAALAATAPTGAEAMTHPRPAPSAHAASSPVIVRYASLRAWAEDAGDLPSALSVRGIAASARTLWHLTTRLPTFLHDLSGEGDGSLTKGASTPIATMMMGSVANVILGLLGALATGSGHGAWRQLASSLVMDVAVAAPVGLAVARAARPRLRVSQGLAIGCYLQGAAFVPTGAFLALLLLVVATKRVAMRLVAAPIFAGAVVLAVTLVLLGVPWLMAYGAAVATRRAKILAVPAFALLTYASIAAGMAVINPGTAASLGGVVCDAVGSPACADRLEAVAPTLEPSNESLWVSRILTLGARGDKAGMGDVALRGLHELPGSAKLHFYAGEWSFPDDPARREQELGTALALDPAYDDAARELAWMFWSRGALEKVVQHCAGVVPDRAFKEAPRQCRFLAGSALFRLGRLEDARRELEAVEPSLDDPMKLHAKAAIGLRLAGQIPAEQVPFAVGILEVTKGGAADALGVMPGDLLVRLDGQTPKGVEGWVAALGARPAVSSRLEIVSAGGVREIVLAPEVRKLGVVLFSP